MSHQSHFQTKCCRSTFCSSCLFISLFLISISPSTLWATDCVPAIVGLYTQADVDNFQTDYGPCDSLLTLYVEGPDISNLDGLSGVSIRVSLSIENNDALSNVDGLSGITNISHSLWVHNNPLLTNLDGLSKLTSVGDVFAIRNNIALTNVDGLANVTSVGGTLAIIGNTVLTNVDGLSAITSVSAAEHSKYRSLIIEDNLALTNLDGLSSLTIIGRLPPMDWLWVSIQNNPMLTNVNGLSALEQIVGDLIIRNNGSLTSLAGFSSLTRVFEVGISNNNQLGSIDGFSAITSLQSLGIADNETIRNVDGLAKLTRVAADMTIQNNKSLENLDALSRLTHVGRNLQIQSNDQLDQCAGLLNLLDEWDDTEPGPGIDPVPDVGSEILFGGNLAGCNSIEEILADHEISKINPGLNDAWYYPETDGQGFFITVFPDMGYVSLAWFTYDTELPAEGASANLGDAGHRWFTGIGPIEGNRVMMNIEMTSGGLFDTATVIERTDPAGSDGTIVVTFSSCNTATVEYEISSINQQGLVPIQRVAGDNIVMCEALNLPFDNTD